MSRSLVRLPDKGSIASYWLRTEDGRGRCVLLIDWLEPRCWACGFYNTHYDIPGSPSDDDFHRVWNSAKYLERCHLVPDSLGGTADVSNLVLLCSYCHEMAPDVQDPDIMLRWIQGHPDDGTPWVLLNERTDVIMRSLRAMGVQPEKLVPVLQSPDCVDRLKDAMESHGWSPRWGIGMTPGTWAYLLSTLIEDQAAA